MDGETRNSRGIESETEKESQEHGTVAQRVPTKKRAAAIPGSTASAGVL
jgi:hypothetical protein